MNEMSWPSESPLSQGTPLCCGENCLARSPCIQISCPCHSGWLSLGWRAGHTSQRSSGEQLAFWSLPFLCPVSLQSIQPSPLIYLLLQIGMQGCPLAGTEEMILVCYLGNSPSRGAWWCSGAAWAKPSSPERHCQDTCSGRGPAQEGRGWQTATVRSSHGEKAANANDSSRGRAGREGGTG